MLNMIVSSCPRQSAWREILHGDSEILKWQRLIELNKTRVWLISRDLQTNPILPHGITYSDDGGTTWNIVNQFNDTITNFDDTVNILDIVIIANCILSDSCDICFDLCCIRAAPL